MLGGGLKEERGEELIYGPSVSSLEDGILDTLDSFLADKWPLSFYKHIAFYMEVHTAIIQKNKVSTRKKKDSASLTNSL